MRHILAWLFGFILWVPIVSSTFPQGTTCSVWLYEDGSRMDICVEYKDDGPYRCVYLYDTLGDLVYYECEYTDEYTGE